MKIVFIIIYIFVLLFLQIGVFPHLQINGVFPNLILLSILSLSLIRKKNLIWIIIAGLFLDFYSFNNIIGISVVFLLLSSFLVYFLNQNIFKKTNIFSLISVFLIGIFAFYILSLIFLIPFEFSSFIVLLIYNLVLCLPVFYTLKLITC